MRTTILILAGASSLGFLAQPAAAQDSDIFAGPRVEANVGYDATHANDGIPATPNTLDGVRIGGAVGYDWALGDTFTIGVEGGVGFNVSGDTKAVIGGTALRATAGHDIDASIRVGARVTPSTLVYAKAGYANSRFTLRSTTAGVTTKVSDSDDGWRIGAGVEQKLTDNIYAKAEYRYTSYGNDVSRHQALIGLGYRF